MGVGIYERSFTSDRTVLLELAEPHFELAEWVASLGKLAAKKRS